MQPAIVISGYTLQAAFGIVLGSPHSTGHVPQSVAHELQSSPLLQIESPQYSEGGGHMPQSILQELQSSPLLHI
jgi:hypothetical protein